MQETSFVTFFFDIISHPESSFVPCCFQDVSFLDNETVGDLTSRLGSDCQQVSRVIGNDLNLISRNLLQVFFGFLHF